MHLPMHPGPRLEMAVERSAASMRSLVDSARGLLASAPMESVAEALARGWFRPLEDEALALWFARFMTVRSGLWEVISDLAAARDGEIEAFFQLEEKASRDDPESDGLEWRAFMLGYGAACAVVRLDRFLLEEFATQSSIQRKLNQGFEELRIPRKLYTSIFESFADPSSALLLDQAIRTRNRWRKRVEKSRQDPLLEQVVDALPWLEEALDRSKRRFFRLFARFQSHALRRRAATLRDHGFFSVLESSGRVASEIRASWREPRLHEEIVGRLSAELRPGDILVTRHEQALTNLFLPGFWPHAALYVGTEEQRRQLGVELDGERERLWSGSNRVLEALKDGVRFRPLEETLHVDCAAVIRPRLKSSSIAKGLTRVARHEGKGYNFDFDFFRSDRLVCTEVIYRAFDGLEDLELPLTERGGRPTLSAEDLLDMALDSDHFKVIAVIGAPPSPERLWLGDEAIEPLRLSYREDTD